MELYRRDGILIILVAAGLAAFFLARPVSIVTGRSFEGDRVVAHELRCGTALPILFASRYHEEVPGPATAAECSRAARSRLFLASLLLIGGGWVAGAAIRNGPYRPPEPISSLHPIPPAPRPLSVRERFEEFLKSLSGGERER